MSVARAKAPLMDKKQTMTETSKKCNDGEIDGRQPESEDPLASELQEGCASDRQRSDE